MNQRSRSPIWNEWLQLTRLLHSSRIAFIHEIARYGEADRGQHVLLYWHRSEYRISLQNHIEALEGQELYGLILLRSFALMEFHGKYIQDIIHGKRWHLVHHLPSDEDLLRIQAQRLEKGVEIWGDRLLRGLKRDWRIVDGLAGLVEVSIIRNAVAHGYHTYSKNLVDSAKKRGAILAFGEGDRVSVSFEQCQTYLTRVKSFCRRLDGGILNVSALQIEQKLPHTT